MSKTNLKGGIACPECGSRSVRTIDSRPTTKGIRRRRECCCGQRFTTYEVTAEQYKQFITIQRAIGNV